MDEELVQIFQSFVPVFFCISTSLELILQPRRYKCTIAPDATLSGVQPPRASNDGNGHLQTLPAGHLRRIYSKYGNITFEM